MFIKSKITKRECKKPAIDHNLAGCIGMKRLLESGPKI